jgi:lipopolysaccharide transport system ATP-binding protein
MGDIAIHAEHLGKVYQLGQSQNAPYKTLRDNLADALTAPFRRAARRDRRLTHSAQATAPAPEDTTHWALKDVSFEIRAGEVVGIIGRNGAGKSTLLKILSRITEPSKGQAQIFGRIASLLEVGTGFHPELTGRENVYLNGAILGMHKVEIDRKFDEIVAFAEIERFLDTPVKFYSSGMYVRLAFAVAAHLEPEILVVDEVLAVGDSRFQKKCLNKMQDVGHEGRTVLFVSHSMPAITRMCERTILLDAGLVLKDGPSQQVVGAYLNSSGEGTSALREYHDAKTAPGGEVARLRAVRVKDQHGRIADSLDIRQAVSIEMEFEVLKGGVVLLPHFHLFNEENVHIFMTMDLDPEWRGKPRPVGRYVSAVTIPGNFLSEGTLFVESAIVTMEPPVLQFTERDAVAFHVIDSMEHDSARGDWAGNLPGMIRPLLPWSTQYLPSR